MDSFAGLVLDLPGSIADDLTPRRPHIAIRYLTCSPVNAQFRKKDELQRVPIRKDLGNQFIIYKKIFAYPLLSSG